jgi:hypothetical protein
MLLQAAGVNIIKVEHKTPQDMFSIGINQLMLVIPTKGLLKQVFCLMPD